MKRTVKCPLCGKLQQTRGRHYFKCCQTGWEVEKNQITSYDEGRYIIPPTQTKKLDVEDLRGYIREIVKKEVEEQRKAFAKVPTTSDKEDELFEILRKDGHLRNYIREFLKNEGIL